MIGVTIFCLSHQCLVCYVSTSNLVDDSEFWANRDRDELCFPCRSCRQFAFQPFRVSRSTSGYAAQARSEIGDLITSKQKLAQKFVRLGFPDCVGACDGCVDLTNPDNNGLDIPIND
jgi:hypothetical protein